MTLCLRCRRELRDIRTERVEPPAVKLARGLAVVARGGTYSEAAKAAGYSDGFHFSRACYETYGKRPRAMVAA